MYIYIVFIQFSGEILKNSRNIENSRRRKKGVQEQIGKKKKGLIYIFTDRYEGDPRSNANKSVISSTFGISKNGLHVYYDILSIL